jgi:uncharacterized protein involved in exopolysaccharide biosynthesis
MAFILGPIILIATTAKVISPPEYPTGDVRNEPAFWLVIGLVTVVVVGVVLFGALREIVGRR